MQEMGNGTNAGPGDVEDQGQPDENIEVPAKKRRSGDIRGILEQSRGGRELVKEMEKGLLTPQSRKQVVGILVSHLIEHHGKYPRTSAKMKMAKSIVEEFPRFDNANGDGYAVWFSPAMDSHDATGFLETRLRNVRKRDPMKEVRLASKSMKPLPRLALSQDDEDEETLNSMVTWLQNHHEPKEQVKTFMAKTCKSRALLIQNNKTKTANDIITLYPRLIDCEGMIDQDFRILFESSSDALFEKWPKMSTKVLAYADKQVEWKKVLNVEGPHSDEEKSNLALQVLPLLFPAGVRRLGKRSVQRATVEESTRAFITVEKVGTNLPMYVESKNEPHVLVLGERRHPEQAFVIVEGNAIPCTSVLKAVDVCFKLTYILDINYSWKCHNTCIFLQKCVYELGKDDGATIPSIVLLNNYIQQE